MTDLKQIKAEGFWLGTQSISVDAALRSLSAVFCQQIEKTNARFATRIKKLEANANVLEERQLTASARWQWFQETTALAPPMLLPLMAVTVAFLLWVGETYLIAPVLDGMGISDPLEQKLVAGVVVLAAATILEVAAHLYRNQNSSFVLRVIAFLLSGATLLFLGWWRGAELIYAAAKGNGALETFLSETRGLTSVVVTLLTIILPVGATLALDWGLSQARFSWSWRKARKSYARLTVTYESVARDLETIRIKRACEAAVWTQRREEYTNAYLQAYEVGRALGAQQLPFEEVAQSILAVVALITAGVLLAAYLLIDPSLAEQINSDFSRLCFYLLFAIGASGVYAMTAIKAWKRPNAVQLYSQRAPIWRTQQQIEGATTCDQEPTRPAPFAGASTKGGAQFDSVNFDDEITRVSPRAA